MATPQLLAALRAEATASPRLGLLLVCSVVLNAVGFSRGRARSMEPTDGNLHHLRHGRMLSQPRDDECPSEIRELHRINAAANKQYGNEYWTWQSTNVITGGKITALLFAPYVTDNVSTIADIGCGSGTVVKNLNAAEKWCVEVNPYARAYVDKTLPDLKTVESANRLPNGHFDLIMSNHALEHTPCPLLLVATLRHKLKPGGRLVFTVPSLQDELKTLEEHHQIKGTFFNQDEQHHHLYVWGPQQLGNMLKVAGYDVLEAKIRRYSRTSQGDAAWSQGGAPAFWRVAERENRHPQTMVVAQRPPQR